MNLAINIVESHISRKTSEIWATRPWPGNERKTRVGLVSPLCRGHGARCGVGQILQMTILHRCIATARYRLFNLRIHFAANQYGSVGDIEPQQEHDDAIEVPIAASVVRVIEIDAGAESRANPEDKRTKRPRRAPPPFTIAEIGREAIEHREREGKRRGQNQPFQAA